MTFNVIDIVLVVLVLLSALNGWRRGFIRGVFDLLAWALSLLAGLRFYASVAHWLGPRVDLWPDVWDRPVAFVIVVIFAFVAVKLVAHAVLLQLPNKIDERLINRLLGIVPGVANGLITAAIVSALLLAIPLNESIRERTRESVLVNRLAGYAERLETALHPVQNDFAEAIAQTLNVLTVEPDSD